MDASEQLMHLLKLLFKPVHLLAKAADYGCSVAMKRLSLICAAFFCTDDPVIWVIKKGRMQQQTDN